MKNPAIFWAVSLLPLFGPLAYLCLRPPLQESQATEAKQIVTSNTP